ncbi:tetratricopeptide repeat protein [Desulfolutivibrio sulfoxidireducens]|uniref:tetratricopeptide repeat protein n=1 Tax=Desulfolutivibrio sulfoxidireducens TaxID=2773299 RepID=UPI00159DB645|nr:tetratricopeptide repeat protein [Desulfolutivibrio sulfoxidireducens]
MRYRFHFLFVLALLPCLISNSCSPKNPGGLGLGAKELSRRAASDYYFLVYQDLLRSGKRDEAAAVLSTLSELTPAPRLLLDLANLYWGMNQRDKAIEILQEGVKRFPEEKQVVFYLASAYQMQRRREEAIAVVRAYLDKNPGDLTGHQEMASLLIDSERYREALDSLEKLQASGPTAAVFFFKAKAFSGLGDRTSAIASLREAIKTDPNMVAAWAELGFLLEQEKDYKGAEESYKKILDLGEEGPEVWLRLIKLNLKLKNPSRAMALLDKAPREDAFVLESLSAFLVEGYAAEAGKLLDRLEKTSPASPDMLFYRAVVAYEGEKKPAKALAYLERVPESHAHYDKSLGFRIQLLLETDKSAKALELARQAAERFPDKKEFSLLAAAALEKTGDVRGSAETLARAGEKWPDDPEILYRLGVVLERQNRRDESVAAMEKIIVLDPNHADALNFVGYTLADENRDLARAMELIGRAVAIEPDNPYFLDSLAWAHFRQGEREKAWEVIRRAVAHPVADPVIWEHYGDIAASLGKKSEAAEGYRKALSGKPDNADELRRKKDAL